MSEIKFSPTPPTKPGYFLFKHSKQDNYPSPVRVAYDDLGGLVSYQGNWCKITELNGLWSHRLVPVDENAPRLDDMALLIRRLCRVISKHDANNTVREQALDYLHRKGLGGSPLHGNKVTTA